MSTIRRNILANYLGKAWLAVMSLAFIPLYVRLLGVEAYGLVGFHVSLAAVLSFMELGMGTTLNRELARLTGRGGRGADGARDLLRSFEWIVWGGSLTLALVVWWASPWIAGHWLRAEGLDTATIARTIALMGAAIALRLPFQVYSGGLCGLQRQGVYNAVLVAGATLRSAGVVPVLFWSPTIEAYFVWQIASEAAQSLFAASLLWRALPSSGGRRPQFRWSTIETVWRFSAGMTLIGILGTLVAQADKFMIGRFLSLESLGIYSVAVAVASGLYYLVYPINTAVFPRFSELHAAGERMLLMNVFHRANRVVAMAIWPAAMMLVLLSPSVINAWMGAANEEVSAVLSWLALGVSLNLLGLLAGSLLQADGLIWPSLLSNLAGLIFIVAWLPFSLPTGGAIEAAKAVVVVNALACAVYFSVLIGRFGAWEIGRGIWRYHLPVAVSSFAVMVAVKGLLPADAGRWQLVVWLAGSLSFGVLLGYGIVAVRDGDWSSKIGGKRDDIG